jgi:hypothetical protein
MCLCSADHAGLIWAELALQCVRDAMPHMQNRTFLCEDVRERIAKDGVALAEPPSLKAWGRVMLLAKARGVIAPAGYAPARSSNLSPKVLWRAA